MTINIDFDIKASTVEPEYVFLQREYEGIPAGRLMVTSNEFAGKVAGQTYYTVVGTHRVVLIEDATLVDTVHPDHPSKTQPLQLTDVEVEFKAFTSSGFVEFEVDKSNWPFCVLKVLINKGMRDNDRLIKLVLLTTEDHLTMSRQKTSEGGLASITCDPQYLMFRIPRLIDEAKDH